MNGALVLSGVRCKCRRWNHRAVRGHTSLSSAPAGSFVYQATESHCPKCSQLDRRGLFYLILWRLHLNPAGIEAVGLAVLHSQSDLHVRLALSRIKPDLNPEEVEEIVASLHAHGHRKREEAAW